REISAAAAAVTAALVFQFPQAGAHLVGVGRHHAALARADGLVGREREASGVAERAQAAAAIFRPESFGGVGDNLEALLLRERLQRIVIRTAAVDVDRYDRAGARSDGFGGFVDIDRE